MEEKIVKPVVNPVQPAPVVPQAEPIETPASPEPVNDPDVRELIPQGDYHLDPLFGVMRDYFNMSMEEADTAKYKLAEITDYVIEFTKSNKVSDVLTALRELDDRITPPMPGERRYTNVYRYVVLARQADSIKKAMAAYEKRGINGK